MSIFATTLCFDADSEDGRPAIGYEGSHVYPDPENRTAELDLGIIPGHIAEGGGFDDVHSHFRYACHRPYLRVGFSDPYGNDYPDRGAAPTRGTIVLDAEQVRELRDNLTDFLERITGDWCIAPERVSEDEKAVDAFWRRPRPEVDDRAYFEHLAKEPAE